jgi:DNA primase
MQPSEEIKSKLDIVDVIRDYIPLKAAGMNFSAKCPFHRENSPSFMVSPDKQIYHCFGCGKGGDVFSFVMEIEGIDFVEALRVLAPKAGVVLKQHDPKITSQRNRILDIIELSRKFYHKVFLDSPAAKAAREYLEARGLLEDTISEWQIGYSPDTWDSLLNFLKSKGFKENEIFLAGMSSKAESSSRFFDRFRGRIMFPINNVNSNTVTFTARVSPEKEKTEKMGKYINGPQTQVYDKSGILFGLDKAKMEIKNHDLAILVEGQMDVITAHQNGFKNVVASSGTALTTEQIKLIKRYTNNIALAFDMDKAGEMAADRGIREAMQAEMNIKVIEVPSGKDPDECIKNNPDEWKRAVENAKPMMQYYFDKTFEKMDLTQVDDQRKAAQRLLPIIAKLGNKIDQDFWINKLSGRIGREEFVLREILAKSKSSGEKKYGNEAGEVALPAKRIKLKEEQQSETMLAVAFKFPVMIEYLTDNLRIEEVVGDTPKALYRNLLFYYNNNIGKAKNDENESVDYDHFKEWLNSEIKNQQNSDQNQLNLLDELVFLGERDFYNKEYAEIRQELTKIVVFLKKEYIRVKMKEIEGLISEMETSGKEEKKKEIRELMEQFQNLSSELRELSDD